MLVAPEALQNWLAEFLSVKAIPFPLISGNTQLRAVFETSILLKIQLRLQPCCLYILQLIDFTIK
jgi:hypothetical protein